MKINYSFKIKPVKQSAHNALLKPVKVGTITKALCILENGVHKAKVTISDKEMIIPFTDKSYELKGRTRIFTRSKDKRGRYICICRTPDRANHFPGCTEVYVPFCPKWIIKGYIMNLNGNYSFDFKALVTIEGHECNSLDIDNYNEDE